MKDRLSSDSLYHFKANSQILKLILTKGFQHRMWPESIPYGKSEQQNFMVCFCDIRIEDAKYHRGCYGNNAIVLTKQWGMANGVSPVRYVHSKSPGISKDYIRTKNKFRSVLTESQGHDDTAIFHYAIFSILSDLKKLHHDSIEDDIAANPGLLKEMQDLETEFYKIFEDLKPLKQDKILTKFLRSIFNRIKELHNELEQRDSFVRAYQEDFTHPATGKTYPNKVLYDEREWRSIKYASKSDYSDAIKNKFLGEYYNLKFNSSDVLAILVEDDKTLNDVKDFLLNTSSLLDPTDAISKLKLIDQHSES